MIEGTILKAAEEMGGIVIGPAQGDFSGLSIDTRTLVPGNLYFAIKGDSFDGHDFIREALEKGASGAVVELPFEKGINGAKLGLSSEKGKIGEGSNLPWEKDLGAEKSELSFTSLANEMKKPLIVVKKSRIALGHLGAYWRKKFHGPVIAISGSSGKTLTKEAIKTVLSSLGPVLATQGNLNNDLGVPLTLAKLDLKKHKFAVIEAGMNQKGELSYLAGIIRPQIVVLTNIGPAHLLGLGSLDGVKKAKAELLEGEPQYFVYNRDDPRLSSLARAFSGKAIGFSFRGKRAAISATATFDGDAMPTGKIRINKKKIMVDGPKIGSDKVQGIGNLRKISPNMNKEQGNISEISEIIARPKLAGFVGVSTICAASAVAGVLEENYELWRDKLDEISSNDMRMNVKNLGNIRIIEDCYNANPQSVQAAVEILAMMEATKRMICLGDMRELGPRWAYYHKRVGNFIGKMAPDLLVTIGEMAKVANCAAKSRGINCYHASSHEEAALYLLKESEEGAIILLKGSRLTQLEKVGKYLWEKSTKQPIYKDI